MHTTRTLIIGKITAILEETIDSVRGDKDNEIVVIDKDNEIDQRGDERVNGVFVSEI